MFIGEMGCWLVVFGSYLWKRFVTPRFSTTPLLQGGYQPVHNDNDEAYESGDEVNEHSHLTNDAAPTARPLLPNDDMRTKLRGWRTFLLAAPACCDITGTTLMNVGLLFVAASIFQMTRGALVLFVGLFSVLFLHRKLYFYQWLALFIVVLGVGLVGLAGAIFPDKTSHPIDEMPKEDVTIIHRVVGDIHASAHTPEAVQAIIGVLLIAGAQVFTATQFVLEEWILEHYAMEPLKVVGWEGIFGFIVTIIGMFILHLAIGQTEHGRYGYFDAKEGWKEMTGNKAVLVSSLLIMISIGYVVNSLFQPSSILIVPPAMNFWRSNTFIAGSTSSALVSHGMYPLHPAAQSTPPVLSSSGSSPSASAGRPSNGCRSSDLRYSSTEPSYSTISSVPLSRPASLAVFELSQTKRS